MTQGKPTPEEIAEFVARDMAYEAMLRVLMDTYAAMLRDDVRERARTVAINKAIRMAELAPLENLDAGVTEIVRRKVAEKIRDVWVHTVRLDN